jgi:hypothetical protein
VADWGHKNLWEVSGLKLKKLYSVGLGFVLFLCIGAEPLVHLICR